MPIVRNSSLNDSTGSFYRSVNNKMEKENDLRNVGVSCLESINEDIRVGSRVAKI